MSVEPAMRVIDLINTAAGHMASQGFESARVEVERLLGSVLGLTRIELYLAFERPLTDEERASFRAQYRRRLAHEPLQHIIGETAFHEITVKTDRRALIPRPETEVLTQTVIDLLSPLDSPRFIDLGTGSGVIALSIANAIPEARGVALDIDPDALALAEENARLLGVDARIRFIEADMFEPPADLGQFDVVVSNPPYVANGDIAGLEPEVRDHDPRRALDGGPDGLSFYRRIGDVAAALLSDDGALLMECGAGQAETVQALIERTGKFTTIGTLPDLTGIQRIVTAKRH